MSLYVVEREEYDHVEFLERITFGYSFRPSTFMVPELRDCNARDGEWYAIITMPHEPVEHEGYTVPAFEGDLERIAWERRRSRY